MIIGDWALAPGNYFKLVITIYIIVISITISLPCSEYPSCLHATAASSWSQWLLHTVPHVSFRQISTLPSYGTSPPTSLVSPSWHLSPYWFNSNNRPIVQSWCLPDWHPAYAYLDMYGLVLLLQFWLSAFILKQSTRLCSFPVHWTLSRCAGTLRYP